MIKDNTKYECESRISMYLLINRVNPWISFLIKKGLKLANKIYNEESNLVKKVSDIIIPAVRLQEVLNS